MKKLFTSAFLFLAVISFAQNTKKDTIMDYLSVPGPISFEKEVYILKFSHFDKNYYKQEYIREEDTLKKFNKMILIDVLQGDLTPKDLVAKKIKEIEGRKGKDPVANYQTFDNKETGEYMLDFLMSEGDLYEWDVYRYKTINTNKGKAVMLFGFSLRSFEGAKLSLDDFFPYFKKSRVDLINTVADYSLPAVIIKE